MGRRGCRFGRGSRRGQAHARDYPAAALRVVGICIRVLDVDPSVRLEVYLVGEVGAGVSVTYYCG